MVGGQHRARSGSSTRPNGCHYGRYICLGRFPALGKNWAPGHKVAQSDGQLWLDILGGLGGSTQEAVAPVMQGVPQIGGEVRPGGQ